jgi:putative tricarboxylic transport membrane protein
MVLIMDRISPYIRLVVLILAIMGVYSFRNTTLDVVVMLSFAVLGIFLKRHEFPLAPIVLGLILGDRAEISLRQSMTISQNDLSIFYTHPISLVLLVSAVVLFFLPVLSKALGSMRESG